MFRSAMMISNKHAAPPPPGGNYWTDSFTDVAGTLLSAHTPDVGVGGYVGAASITAANQVSMTISGMNVNSFSTGQTNVRIGAKYISGSMPGLVLRYVDNSNYALAFFIAGNQVRIYEMIAGAFNQRTAVIFAMKLNDLLSFTDDGSILTLYINGASITSFATVLNNTASKQGIYSYTAATLDDLYVKAYP